VDAGLLGLVLFLGDSTAKLMRGPGVGRGSMNCKTCPVSDFVLKDLYCQKCTRIEKQEPVNGTAYLYRKNKLLPLESERITAEPGSVFAISARKLLQHFRMEFIPDEK